MSTAENTGKEVPTILGELLCRGVSSTAKLRKKVESGIMAWAETQGQMTELTYQVTIEKSVDEDLIHCEALIYSSGASWSGSGEGQGETAAFSDCLSRLSRKDKQGAHSAGLSRGPSDAGSDSKLHA